MEYPEKIQAMVYTNSRHEGLVISKWGILKVVRTWR